MNDKTEDITLELQDADKDPVAEGVAEALANKTPEEFDFTKALVQHVRWAEGSRAFPYEDSVGKLTIGVGRNLDDVGLSEDEIQFLLQNDLDKALTDAKSFPWFADLDDVRKLVVVDMIFNLGKPRFSSFVRTIAAIEAQQWQAAAMQMQDSKWFRQVGRRAQRLVQAMASGKWQ